MWHFYSPIRANRPPKSASRSLILYGGMIADDIVVQCRIAKLIEALDATLVAISQSSIDPSSQTTTRQPDLP